MAYESALHIIAMVKMHHCLQKSLYVEFLTCYVAKDATVHCYRELPDFVYISFMNAD